MELCPKVNDLFDRLVPEFTIICYLVDRIWLEGNLSSTTTAHRNGDKIRPLNDPICFCSTSSSRLGDLKESLRSFMEKVFLNALARDIFRQSPTV